MKVLGIHFGHDANMALFVGGELVAYHEKERHSRVRHALGIRGSEIVEFLNKHGLRLKDIDICSLGSTQYVPILDWDGDFEISTLDPVRVAVRKESRDFFSGLQADHPYHLMRKWADKSAKQHFLFPPGFPSLFHSNRFIGPLSSIANSARFVNHRDAHIQEIEFRLRDETPRKAYWVCHHMSHAQYAYSHSPYSRALIVTFDGTTSRDFSGGGVYFGTDGIAYPAIPHGFMGGGFYDRIVRRIGLPTLGGAGKLMGLAAYGVPAFFDADLIGNLFDLQRKGNFPNGAVLADYWMDEIALRGKALPAWDGQGQPPELHANIASSAQSLFQHLVDATVSAAVSFARRVGHAFDGICLSGGCALNCPANTQMAAKFGNVFVPPAVNDEGLGLGNALMFVTGWKQPRLSPRIAYVGNEYSADVAGTLREFEDRIEVVVETSDAIPRLASELHEGKIAGFYTGRAEIGPRALGHRSILASPLIADHIVKVNAVKTREVWRPFAPMATEEAASRWFSHVPSGCHFMLFNTRTKGRSLPAITHVDGTARLQVATPDCGPAHELLKCFGRISGFEVLLNTSFNGKAEPIVETPRDALNAFLRMGLDLLYIEGRLVKRRGEVVPKRRKAKS